MLFTRGKNMDVLYKNLCILSERKPLKTDDKEEVIQEILNTYELVEANLMRKDKLKDFTVAKNVIVRTNKCLSNNIDDIYPNHYKEHTCLCSKTGLIREFRLLSADKQHSIIIGSKCISKHSPKHTDLMKLIMKTHILLERNAAIEKRMMNYFPEISLSQKIDKDYKHELLLETTIKILKNRVLFDRIHKITNLVPLHKGSKVQYYYGIVHDQWLNDELSQRNAANVKRENVYKWLESYVFNWTRSKSPY